MKEDVEPSNLIQAGALANERILDFRGRIELTYWQEREERQFARHRRIRHQTSTLSLRTRPVVIDTLGHVYKPLRILKGGYMGWERVAEMLPWEYTSEDVGSR